MSAGRKTAALLVLGLFVVLALAASSAYAARHPDTCLDCHADTANDVVSNNEAAATALGRPVWNHTIYTSEAWNRCSFCHGGIAERVGQSVHKNVGCGCHAVVHTGKYYGLQPSTAQTGKWAAWMILKVANFTGTPILAPRIQSPAELVTKKYYFDETSNGTLGQDLRTWLQNWTGGNDTQEIEVWLADANGTILDNSPGREHYQVCFNCHFLTADPGDLGVFKLIGNTWKIGIPETALYASPHEITAEGFGTVAEIGPRMPDFMSLLSVILAAVFMLLMMRRH